MPSPSTLEEFFEKRVMTEPNTGCWFYLAHRDGNGYCDIQRGGGKGPRYKAHRFFYETWKVEIPSGLQLDHLCRVRHCVNPDHLEPVTAQINTLRSLAPAAFFAKRTECPKGHPFSPDNTLIRWSGGKHRRRVCKICDLNKNYLR